MEISESTQSALRETCLGLPFVEERPITEEERAELQKEARQSLVLMFLCMNLTNWKYSAILDGCGG